MADTPAAPHKGRSPSSSQLTLDREESATNPPTFKSVPEGDPMDIVRGEQDAREQPVEPAGNMRKEEETPVSRGQRVGKAALRVLNILIDQWFLIGIGVFIVLAWAFPNVARQGGIIQAEWSIRLLAVAIIFFISGLSIPLRNMYIRALDWRLHLICNITTFLLFPTVVFAIVSAVQAADPEHKRFDRWALVGLVVMGVMPTTVSSNVTMTGLAGGDVAGTTIEVLLGNTLGTFLTPALLEMFLSDSTWDFGKPVASGGGGIGEVYRQVIEQLGYSVFIPLFVGECVQNTFPKQTKWCLRTFYLAKVGTFCLLLVIWSTFSGAFHAGAFEILTGEAIAMIVCVNLGLYLLFSALLFAVCRLIPFPRGIVMENKRGKGEVGPLLAPETTISALFCGGAKGAALGAPIVSILYGGLAPEARGIVSLPLVLYQGTQVALGQGAVIVLRKWNERQKRRAKEEADGRGGENRAAG
ncbi:LRR receptor-like serine/threonine-protein kinase RGI2 [Rhodotorula kratochvilovae]